MFRIGDEFVRIGSLSSLFDVEYDVNIIRARFNVMEDEFRIIRVVGVPNGCEPFVRYIVKFHPELRQFIIYILRNMDLFSDADGSSNIPGDWNSWKRYPWNPYLKLDPCNTVFYEYMDALAEISLLNICHPDNVMSRGYMSHYIREKLAHKKMEEVLSKVNYYIGEYIGILYILPIIKSMKVTHKEYKLMNLVLEYVGSGDFKKSRLLGKLNLKN
jgi:hypothetical protein